jgi:energy-converting hydrogenase Eha subunit C
MAIFGESLTVMRAVSILGTVTTAVCIVLLVRRATRHFAFSFASAGLFLGTFAACGAWFDVARVDMLALGMCTLGLVLADRGSRPVAFSTGVALISLSSFVKQTQVAFLVALVAVWLVWDRRRGLWAWLRGGAICCTCFLALQVTSDGWFASYTVTMPGGAPRMGKKILAFWTDDLRDIAGWTLPLALVGLIALIRGNKWRVLPLLLLPVALLVSASGRSNPGGYVNNLVVASAFLAAAAGIGMSVLPRSPPMPRSAAAKRPVEGCLRNMTRAPF